MRGSPRSQQGFVAITVDMGAEKRLSGRGTLGVPSESLNSHCQHGLLPICTSSCIFWIVSFADLLPMAEPMSAQSGQELPKLCPKRGHLRDVPHLGFLLLLQGWALFLRRLCRWPQEWASPLGSPCPLCTHTGTIRSRGEVYTFEQDGVKWTEAYATDSNLLGTSCISLGDVPAAKVRMVMKKCSIASLHQRF